MNYNVMLVLLADIDYETSLDMKMMEDNEQVLLPEDMRHFLQQYHSEQVPAAGHQLLHNNNSNSSNNSNVEEWVKQTNSHNQHMHHHHNQ